MGKLTQVKIKNLNAPGVYGDGGNLYFQVMKTGSRSWVFRYMLHGKARYLGLGPYPLVSLKEAREKAIDNRRKLLNGVDPIEEKRSHVSEARVKASKVLTFKNASENFLKSNEISWKNEKHRRQWYSTLETYAYPVIGDLSVTDIETPHVLQILEPIWQIKSETASRVRQRVERIIDYATARGYREGVNPAIWRGHLDKILPPRAKVKKPQNHPALPWSDIPEFMKMLRERDSLSARALELTILTSARTSEIIKAKWQEVEIDNAIWTVPPERMKAGREHRVPLTNRSIEILEELPRIEDNNFLFPGSRVGTSISNMAMLELLRGMRSGLTVHGFRSTFRDWASEATAHPPDVCEMALAHTIKNKSEAAYRRGDLFEKRRLLMNDWSEYCGSQS